MKIISSLRFLFPSKRLLNTGYSGLIVLGCIFVFSSLSGQTVTPDSTRKQTQTDSVKLVKDQQEQLEKQFQSWKAAQMKTEENPTKTNSPSYIQDSGVPKQTIIGERFCDVRFEGENVIFENIKFANANVKFETPLQNETEGNFNKGTTVVYVPQTRSVFIHCGYLLAHYRFKDNPKELGGVELTQPLTSEMTGKPLEPGGRVTKDGGLAIFQSEDFTFMYDTQKKGKESTYGIPGTKLATYEDVANGIYIETTATGLFVKVKETVLSQTYKDMFGEKMTDMKNPRFSKGSDGKIEMRDDNLVTPNGKPVVLTIPIADLDKINLSLDNADIGSK